ERDGVQRTESIMVHIIVTGRVDFQKHNRRPRFGNAGRTFCLISHRAWPRRGSSSVGGLRWRLPRARAQCRRPLVQALIVTRSPPFYRQVLSSRRGLYGPPPEPTPRVVARGPTSSPPDSEEPVDPRYAARVPEVLSGVQSTPIESTQCIARNRT